MYLEPLQSNYISLQIVIYKKHVKLWTILDTLGPFASPWLQAWLVPQFQSAQARSQGGSRGVERPTHVWKGPPDC